MKSMKIILVLVLSFGTLPWTLNLSLANGLREDQIVVKDLSLDSLPKAKSQAAIPQTLEVEPDVIEVELIRMIDPSGNEVKYSLSEKVMGRKLSSDDYAIPGVAQVAHSQICQETLSSAQELRKVELKLEVEMLTEELSKQPKPRFLSQVQMDLLETIPQCEVFQLHLTAIAKLLNGYDYDSFAFTQANRD